MTSPIASKPTAHRHPNRDRGMTFVELMVALVLLGTTIVAVMTALRTTTVASSTDAQHARAYAWLHDASDSIFETPRTACNKYKGTGDAASLSSWLINIGTSTDTAASGTVWGVYSDAVRNTPRPSGWSGGTISIAKIEFLKPTGPETNVFDWGSTCFEGVIPDADADGNPDDYRDTPLTSQKITISVTSPDGSFTKMLETVKSVR